jgi:hypothetical protein
MIEVFFLLLALGFLALPFLALSAARHAGGRCRELGEELQRLREQQVLALEREQRLARRIADLEAAGREGPPRTASAAAAASTPVRSAAEPSSPNEAKPRATPPPAAEPAAALILPPPLPGAAAIAPPPSIDTPKPAAPVPAPLPVAESEHHPAPLPVAEPALHMERFMGAKLFAWIGGLALFLGILFFVKLSLERGWISPALRTWTGLAVGAGLVGAGLRLQRNPRQTALAQTLCATGIVALYGVAFAAHALWRIPPFHLPLVTFAFLSAVTAAAFTLAVRHHAQVVAVLGMLGGFLTPVLCSTGEDRPFALFSYIALLDLGVLAVAQRRRWAHLTPLAAAGTLMTLIGWLLSFFRASEYGIGSATWLPVGLLLGFPLLFALAAVWMRRRGETGQAPAWAALGLAAGHQHRHAALGSLQPRARFECPRPGPGCLATAVAPGADLHCHPDFPAPAALDVRPAVDRAAAAGPGGLPRLRRAAQCLRRLAAASPADAADRLAAAPDRGPAAAAGLAAAEPGSGAVAGTAARRPAGHRSGLADRCPAARAGGPGADPAGHRSLAVRCSF